MAGLAFTITSPDPSATQWGPDLSKTRENINSVVMYAASNGGRLPGWNTAITYSGGNVSYVVLTFKDDTDIKIKIMYDYNASGNITEEEYFFDKGAGAGYEQITNGAAVYGYDVSNNLTSVTFSSSYTMTP